MILDHKKLEFISQEAFVDKVTAKLATFNDKFFSLENKIDSFAKAIKQLRIPSFLNENEMFLGKYLIVGILPYTKIYS